ncbi:MAG: (d)CMP kinase [SAR202 cluster bacterium]|nr:(d)CMP kinase [SAR202 cluster bacterium]
MPKISTISIDGPVAAGKSAVGTLLASRLGYRFIDTGMMYRSVTWAVINNQVDLEDEEAVTNIANQTIIEVGTGENPEIKVDGENVAGQLRTRPVEQGVSRISRFLGVRKAMVSRQRLLGTNGNIIMAGRDIGTVVLPDADLKIFLTASAEERARRRHQEILGSGQSITFDQVLQDLKQRDKLDTERTNSPLKPAEHSTILNTDNIELTDVVDQIISIIEKLR